jgi:SAM-dependent methyltransferase
MAPTFRDHFSDVARQYAAHRPRYPTELFEWLGSQCRGHDLAWDCATGTGQAAGALTQRFARVVASDASSTQLLAADARSGVDYVRCSAEVAPLRSACADLVTVAQALHWLDCAAFFGEATRVLRPGGVLAIWGYGFMTIDDAVDEPARTFYHDTLGPHWPPGRALVEARYEGITFPFAERPAPSFVMEQHWTLTQLEGYVRTWSAVLRHDAARGGDALAIFRATVGPRWGDPETPRTVRWPLYLRVGSTS